MRFDDIRDDVFLEDIYGAEESVLEADKIDMADHKYERGRTQEASTKPKKSAAKSELESVKEELKTAKNDYMRLAADFANFRKNSAAHALTLRGQITADIMEEFLPLADNYELALKYLDANAKAGVQLIYKQLMEILAKYKVKEMEVEGKKFDPDIHEAVETVESQATSGTIVEVLKKGYMIGDKVIRYPKVIVAK